MKNIPFSKALGEPLTFEAAVEYFGDKLPVDKATFYSLSAKYRQKAFTVAGYTSATVLNRFYQTVLKALQEGKTLEDFRKDMNTFLKDKGYAGMTPFQADNIFRTNVQTAYNVGHYQRMASPAVKRLRPYWLYDAVDDKHTREQHRALDGKVYPADHPFWDVWYPPNGYRCRCAVRSLSERQVQAMGLRVETDPELPVAVTHGKFGTFMPLIPQPGFGRNPALEDWKPDVSQMPEALQKAWKMKMEVRE